MKAFRTTPRVFCLLHNFGISASLSAVMLTAWKGRFERPIESPIEHQVIREVLRACIQNRHLLRRSLPGPARYRL